MKSSVFKIIPNEKIKDEEVRKTGMNMYVFGICAMAHNSEDAALKIKAEFPGIKLVREG